MNDVPDHFVSRKLGKDIFANLLYGKNEKIFRKKFRPFCVKGNDLKHQEPWTLAQEPSYKVHGHLHKDVGPGALHKNLGRWPK